MDTKLYVKDFGGLTLKLEKLIREETGYAAGEIWTVIDNFMNDNFTDVRHCPHCKQVMPAVEAKKPKAFRVEALAGRSDGRNFLLKKPDNAGRWWGTKGSVFTSEDQVGKILGQTWKCDIYKVVPA